MTEFPRAPDEQLTQELLGRIQAGEEEAWDDLYRRYHDELLFAVRARLGVRLRRFLESEDVLQSVALEAFRALPRFEDRGRGSLRGYLHRLILNKIRDRADYHGAQKRGADRQAGSEALDEVAVEGPRYLAGERYERLERCLQALPEEMRAVVVLRQIDGLSSKECAAELGKSDAAVRKLFSRAMARLASAMLSAGDGD